MFASPKPRLRAVPALLAVLLLLSVAAGQTCRSELAGALRDRSFEREATGVDAALLMRRAVELVEPALPALVDVHEAGIAADHPAHDTVLYLRRRGLLPNGWRPDVLPLEAWRQMHARFLSWYQLDGPLPETAATVEDLLRGMDETVGRVGRTVRPAALLATDPDDGRSLSFWAIIWNWTVYPRLLVYRPEPGLEVGRSPRDVLPLLSNCAVTVDAFVTAPERTAKELFLTHNESRMYVVATHPTGGSWPLEVAQGEELAAFGFELPELDGAQVYAAVFDGPEVGFGKLIGLMTRVRTNLSPAGFLSHLQTP